MKHIIKLWIWGGFSTRARSEDLMLSGPVVAEGRDLAALGGDGVSERGGGFCCELEKGQPDKQSPVLACMHVSRDCLS